MPPSLQPLLSPPQIAEAVARLAAAIRQDYAGRQPLLVGVLKGAFVFLADLVRALDMPLSVGFVRLASYRGTGSSGAVQLLCDLQEPVAKRDVLLVEGVVDSGRTAAWLWQHLAAQQPASLRLCTLLDKPARRQVPVQIDYRGFTLPDVFVVGYGLDCNEQYRHLPGLYVLQAPGDTASPRGFEPLLPD
ncbi:MAG: hypoxanthine phosphoribosyltransferase [Candidatus Tectimicrobiota bacterium]|nr:MAG: hypoxanthine phosphoribosyltransferase [Candidatus Tectomicrobia bacterium]